MSLFNDAYILANDPIFKERVMVAIAKVSVQIVGEAVTTGDEKKHEKRHRLGVKILNDPSLMLMPFSYTVVSGGVLTLASSDADIEFTVTSVFDDMAGVLITD